MTQSKIDALKALAQLKEFAMDEAGWAWPDVADNLEATIKAALEQEERGWTPIETAPKDMPIIGYFDPGEHPFACECKYSTDRDAWLNIGDEYMGKAEDVCLTHWMPLPTPPTSETESAGVQDTQAKGVGDE